ncbi:hypothetical protein CEN47_01585 [Fischerella thermalis CCMEE 5319]|nr:hypothetical protein CEN47_01585 [Fischerella thermalis CCMEE 5319]
MAKHDHCRLFQEAQLARGNADEIFSQKPHPQKISRPELKFRANSKSPLKWTEFLSSSLFRGFLL